MLAEDAREIGLGGETYRVGQIESSTNLVSWSVLAGFTNNTGVINIVEPAANSNNFRFYRGRFAP